MPMDVPVYILQLCTIKKGKSYNGKLSDTQTSEMIVQARKAPAELEQAIMDRVRILLTKK
jgi:hypothetical protein